MKAGEFKALLKDVPDDFEILVEVDVYDTREIVSGQFAHLEKRQSGRLGWSYDTPLNAFLLHGRQ
jgi:hypothetical protein